MRVKHFQDEKRKEVFPISLSEVFSEVFSFLFFSFESILKSKSIS